MGKTAAKLYRRMVKADDAAVDKLPAEVRQNVPGNGLRLVAANALQNTGDQVVSASTVLASLGAPGWIIGLLVPVRESGSMLPQAALTPWVRGRRQRKWIWVAGAAGQAIAVAAMAFTATVWTGATAGIAILAELAVFALARAGTGLHCLQGRPGPHHSQGPARPDQRHRRPGLRRRRR